MDMFVDHRLHCHWSSVTPVEKDRLSGRGIDNT